MGDDSKCVSEMISQLRVLTEANSKKCEYETILKELNLFSNFVIICKRKRMGTSSETVLQCTVKVLPDSLPESSNTGENVVITVKNLSNAFTFNPKFWQFSIDFCGGRQVCACTFENSLEFGKSEVFYTKFQPDENFLAVEVKINAVFTLNFKDKSHLKILEVDKVLIDILHYLNPGRRPIYFPSRPSYQSAPPFFSGLDPHLAESAKNLPPITRFEFRFDALLRKVFFEEIFLRDSMHRGFEPDCMLNKCEGNELSVYFHGEKITVVVDKGGTISFSCNNPRMLFALKISIFRRLMNTENIKVQCPDDKICEKLFAFKLKLESLSTATGDDLRATKVDFGDLMEIYLELRCFSESVKYILLENIE